MEYTTLDFSRFETRFLRFIDPRRVRLGQLLRFEVETCTLSSPPDYFALSYCWGDGSRRTEIEVAGKIVEISENLEHALRHSSLPLGGLIWADAICINQSDLFEKAYQVNMMGQIYAKARKVIAWLGLESEESRLAVTLVQRISQIKEIPPPYSSQARAGDDAPSRLEDSFLVSIKEHSNPAKALRGLTELLSRPYWERVWIIQEIAKAETVEIRCGELQIDLEGILYAGARHAGLPERNRNLLAAISEFRKQEQMKMGRMSLMQALLTSRFSLATDERDKVYALLGLASDSADLVPTPTYVDPVPEVFEQLTKRILESQQSGNVALLATRAPLLRRFPESSSWAIDWAELALYVPQWLISSANAVPKPDSRTPIVKDSILHTHGRRIGEITSTEVRRPRSWRSTCSEQNETFVFAIMSGLTTSILERLIIKDPAIAALERNTMTYTLARMIRDADKGLSSDKYNLARVYYTLFRLGRLYIKDIPIWQWARQINFHRDREQREGREAIDRPNTLRSDTTPDSRDQIAPHKSESVGCWGSLLRLFRRSPIQDTPVNGGQQVPSTFGSTRGLVDTASVSQNFDEQTENPSNTSSALPTPVAFRLWEDILATFNDLPQNQLQFAIVGEEHLVVVHRNASEYDGIYQINHCKLPVVLQEKGWHGDHTLIGEAYVGRQWNGDWMGADASFLDRRPFPEPADSAIRISLARSAVDYTFDFD